MKGKHIRKEKKSIVWILITLFVLIGVIFGYFHFKSDDQENLSQYKIIVGTIKNVGDETLLIETNDHQKYLISIAGAIDSNKGLIKGNRIYIYYEGTLDIKNKDIQSIKVNHIKYWSNKPRTIPIKEGIVSFLFSILIFSFSSTNIHIETKNKSTHISRCSKVLPTIKVKNVYKIVFKYFFKYSLNKGEYLKSLLRYF